MRTFSLFLAFAFGLCLGHAEFDPAPVVWISGLLFGVLALISFSFGNSEDRP